MENFKEIYKELATNLSEIDGVKWVDLWNSQVYNLEGEHPFPAPAVFLAFRSQLMENAGIKIQKVKMQIDVFLFFETFADTYHESWNQTEALKYLDILDQINFKLHGSSGATYTGMSRISFSPVDTGGAGNLYNLVYECTVIDYSAVKPLEDGTFADMNIVPASAQGYIID
jgi:hypothetical protein